MDKKISFTLSPEQVRSALFLTGFLRPYKQKLIAIGLFSVVMAVLILTSPTGTGLFTLGVLVVTNILAFFGYRAAERGRIRASTTGEEMEVTFLSDRLNIVVKAYDADWDILPSDVIRVAVDEELAVIVLSDLRLVPLPLALIDAAQKEWLTALNDKADEAAEESAKIEEKSEKTEENTAD